MIRQVLAAMRVHIRERQTVIDVTEGITISADFVLQCALSYTADNISAGQTSHSVSMHTSVPV